MLLQQSITDLVSFKEKKFIFFSARTTSVEGLLHHSVVEDRWDNKSMAMALSYTIDLATPTGTCLNRCCTDDWLSCTWDLGSTLNHAVHTMNCHSGIKRNGELILTTTWMDCENIMLGGRAKLKNTMYWPVLCTRRRKSRQWERMQRRGCPEAGEVALQCLLHGFSFPWWKLAADSMVAMAVQPCEHIKMLAFMVCQF